MCTQSLYLIEDLSFKHSFSFRPCLTIKFLRTMKSVSVQLCLLFQLLQINRTSETTWETKNILPVSFASLIMPNGNGPVDLIDLRKIFYLYAQQ